MNERYKRIILVTDSSETSHAAEQTALDLAKRHSASLLAVDAVRPPSFASKWLTSNSEDLFDIVVNDKRERLEKVTKQFSEAGVDVKTRILLGKSSEEVARTAITENADLVVRYMKGARSQHESQIGTTARNLMRVCPSPLLLVGEKPVSDPTILACVNAEHDFNENEAVLSEAEKLAERTEKLHALYCWKFQGCEFLSEYMNEETTQGLLKEAEQNYRGIYERFLPKHDLTAYDKGVHMQEGDPVHAIPEICQNESIDVVVMSSASQNHPLHLLLGSTVEAVLDKLPCSLLVVKPLGFKSPIKPAALNVESGNS